MATYLPRPNVLPLAPCAPHLRGSAVYRMVQEEQGGPVVAAAPQWPPAEGASNVGPQHKIGTHNFMAKCARLGGRSVEWPPRGDQQSRQHYGSNPVLDSSQVAPPPVPPRPLNYPLKAHASAPNLLDDQTPRHGRTKLTNQPSSTKSEETDPEVCHTSTTKSQETSLKSGASLENLVPSSTGNSKMESHQSVSSSSSSSQQPNQPGGDDPKLTTVFPSNFKLRSEMPVQQEGAKVYQSQPAFKSTKPIKMRGDNKWPPSGAGEEDTTTTQQVREFVKPKKQNKDYSGFFAQHQLPSSYTGYRAPPGTQHVGCAEDDDGATDM